MKNDFNVKKKWEIKVNLFSFFLKKNLDDKELGINRKTFLEAWEILETNKMEKKNLRDENEILKKNWGTKVRHYCLFWSKSSVRLLVQLGTINFTVSSGQK